jgi:hypothetical protein
MTVCRREVHVLVIAGPRWVVRRQDPDRHAAEPPQLDAAFASGVDRGGGLCDDIRGMCGHASVSTTTAAVHTSVASTEGAGEQALDNGGGMADSP